MSTADEKPAQVAPGAEVKDEEEDDDVPDVEADGQVSKLSRAEKKIRKALEKAGLKAVHGINRVTMKNATKQFVFAITAPEVLKSPLTDTYVIFGEAKPEDMSSLRQNFAAQQFQAPAASDATSSSAAPEEDDGAPEDETGLSAEEIQTVIDLTKASRNKVIRALRETNGNVVDAVLKFTPQ